MSSQQAILGAAALSTLAPLVAVLLRGRARHILVLVTALTAAAVSAYLAILLRLLAVGPALSPNAWVYALAASALPILLTGYLLSVGFGRDQPEACYRDARRDFLLLGLVGLGFLALLRDGRFISGYDWLYGRGTIHLGFIGKAYASYLLIGIVLIGHNLEKTYRLTSTERRPRLHLALLGFFAVLGFFTFILATGLLYAAIGLGKLIAAGLPLAFASLGIAHGFLRGSITDATTRVSRHLVYSSFTAMAAGLFVLAIGLAAQLASLTGWSPDEILLVTVSFLAALIGLLLLFSNRFQRAVRRYIDRNFYVNRYDYRTQWSRITESLSSVTDTATLLNRAASLLTEMLAADQVTIALRNPVTSEFEPVRGKGAGSHEVLGEDSPLCQRLTRGGTALLLDRNPHDLTYIPIYAENERWLAETASQIVSPLLHAGVLIGTLGLERRDTRDRFTFEDVALLDAIGAHVAAALGSLSLAAELARSREGHLVSQWSAMILHDLKNFVAPLRMIAVNLREAHRDPETVAVCTRDLERVTARLDHLVAGLGQLREIPRLNITAVDPNDVVRRTLATLSPDQRSAIGLDLSLEARQPIRADGELLLRVLENLVTNAVEAMDAGGTLSIRTEDHQRNGAPEVHIAVGDTGRGIPEDFVRERLFRPFATTKPKGFGLGLYHSRAIIQAHGGRLTVKSRAGHGAVFRIVLSAVDPAAPSEPEVDEPHPPDDGEAAR